jgi:hypothetical protein
VVLYATDVRNTSAPGSLTNTGTTWRPGGADDPRRLVNSGWQWMGYLGQVTGIPIAPQYFITAAHAGGIDEAIVVNGVSYPIDKNFNIPNVQWWADDPNSDLRIFKIQGTFDSYAPLYDEAPGSEIGRRLVAFGRGAPRGAEVRVNGELKGWKWGPQDRLLAWGENVVSDVYDFGTSFGPAVQFDFDRNGLANEAALSNGDSGGGIFIHSGGAWKLAGINFTADGPFRVDSADQPFLGSMFDMGGLLLGDPDPVLVPDALEDAAGRSFSTEIAANLPWIHSVIDARSDVPEPMGLTAFAIALPPLLLRRPGKTNP